MPEQQKMVAAEASTPPTRSTTPMLQNKTYTAELVHHLPGRTRLSIPQLRSRPLALAHLRQALGQHAAVDEVKVNTQRANVVILHKLELHELQALLAAAGVNPLLTDLLAESNAFDWLSTHWDDLDRTLSEKTGGRLHLSTLVLLALGGLSVYQLRKAKTLGQGIRSLVHQLSKLRA